MAALVSLLALLGEGAGGYAAWADRTLDEALIAAADLEHRLADEAQRKRRR